MSKAREIAELGDALTVDGSGNIDVTGTVTATALAGDGTGITGVATAAQGALADTAVQPADNISTLTNDAGYLTVAPSPFTPTTVTGTTPSLDVGTYNYFEQGELTGDTTVTFASVPTEARWTYSFIGDLYTTFDIGNASFVQSFSVAAQEAQPFGVFFKPDGTKMYVVGGTGDDVNEYDLSTPWDVSTASFLQLKSVATEDSNPRGLFFKPDGTKMYVVGSTGDDVNEYDLSTPWNVTTASFLQLKSVATEEASPSGVFFKPDGTKMYIVGSSGDEVNEYDLSTPWNVTTAVFLQLKSVSTEESAPNGIFFKPDGTTMYVVGISGDDVNEYSLTVPWDIASAFFKRSFSVAAQEVQPFAVFFKPDGTKMYVVGPISDAVHEYDTISGTTLTLPASVQNPPTLDSDVGSTVTYEFATLDGGTTVRLIKEEVL